LDQQARILFDQDQYWIKDLTSRNSVLLDNLPIAGQAALQPDMELALSPQGPRFRYLNNGRLVEFEASLPEAPPASAPQAAPEVS
jgi:hypothetical protein